MAVSTKSYSPDVKEKNKIALLGHVRWEHCFAGVAGGIVSTLVLHPLDLVKIRFQVNEGVTGVANVIRPQYRGLSDAFLTIGRSEGVKGLYQGVAPNIIGAGMSWGLYFLFYNSLKTWTQEKHNQKSLHAGQHMLLAAEAGILTLTLSNPIWVVKTRLCLQYDNLSSESVKGPHYRGMGDCLKQIFRAEGIRGLYKGFVPGLFGVSHGALQFMAYEELKKVYNRYRNLPVDTRFNSLEYITFAAISKIFAASITYPYQVVRSRLQDQHRMYGSARDVVLQIWRLEGRRGFFKGLLPSLLRVTPACCITFIVYEKITGYLLH